MRKFKPFGPWVQIKKIEDGETKTASGLILETKESDYSKGEVVEVGTGTKLADGTIIGFRVKKGDIVLFKHFTGKELEIEGDKYILCYESDIMMFQE